MKYILILCVVLGGCASIPKNELSNYEDNNGIGYYYVIPNCKFTNPSFNVAYPKAPTLKEEK